MGNLGPLHPANDPCLRSVPRLVVRCLWPLQPERGVLPSQLHDSPVQWHEMALLEGAQPQAEGHDHDDPASGLLRMGSKLGLSHHHRGKTGLVES